MNNPSTRFSSHLWKPVICFVALTLMIHFSGCDYSSNTEGSKSGDGASSTSGDTGAKQFLSVGTAPQGGAFAPVGNAIAGVVEANKGELNWSVAPEGTKGTQENIRKLEAGEIEFGMANAAIAYFATRGEGGWEKPHNVRAVATIAPNVGIFVTTKATGIKTMADMKGKRVVMGPSGAGFDYFLKPLLKVHGLTYEDLGDALNGNYISAQDQIADGKADAAFMGG
ncbi:MAG: TAXI family TRAP transporter solute-binding subunit, partial [Planctomycetota bacterium]